MAEDPAQAAVVAVQHPVEESLETAADTSGRSLVFAGEEQRAHHRRQRQRDESRGYDGDAHRHRKLMKQPADDAGHEQQRNEYGNQGERDRDDGEADLARAAQCGLEGGSAGLDVADDVFDHHDGVVDHEADGDGQPHQRQIVDAVAEQVHGAERGDDRERNGHARNRRRPRLAQERKDDQHHQDDRDEQGHLHVARPTRGCSASGR